MLTLIMLTMPNTNSIAIQLIVMVYNIYKVQRIIVVAFTGLLLK